jgi:hypothetical protein
VQVRQLELHVQAESPTHAPDRCSASIAALRRPQNSVGPDALGVLGPCFAARETSENLQMISQRRKRLAFAPAASDVRFSVWSSALPLWHWSGDGAATPVTLGSCLMVRRSHGYPDFPPRLTHRRDVCVAWIRLPSVVAT